MRDDSPQSLAETDMAPQHAVPRSDASSRSVGEVIAGKYELTRYLARGGMAEVWLATHVNLRTEVAVKFVSLALVRDRSSGPYAIERFRFEAQISARLGAKSRHVVAVHDTGVHQEIPYLVMEYVPGHTLEAEIETRGALAPDRFAAILDQIADALGAAHALGIIHRDLKPSNVMLVDEPGGALLAKVADFGVAKAVGKHLEVDKPRETTAGELVGSPAFMSPEQVRGVSAVDPRTDVWAIGVIAYEVLTGRICFDGQTVPDMITSILATEPVRPTLIRPDLPSALDRWFEQALAKDPDRRFATVAEMAAAFRGALKPPSRRRMWPVVAGVLLAAAALLAAALMLPRSAETRGAEARGAPSTAVPQAASPAEIAPTATASASASEASGPASTSPQASPARTAPRKGGAPAIATATATVTAPPRAEVTQPPQPQPAPAPAPPKKGIDPSEIQ